VEVFPKPLAKKSRSLLLVAAAILLTASNPTTELRHAEDEREFTVEIGPVDLPGADAHAHHGGSGPHAHTNAILPPVTEVKIPTDAYVNGFRVSVVDGSGKEVPHDLIHHLNFIDPENRELFLPISQRMLAVGKETGSHRFPKVLFGYPVRRGQPMVVSAMLHNPHPTTYSAVRVRVTFEYTRTRRPWPLFRVYPFQLDVLFPHGDKSFDLPPGRTERSYDASPVIDGRIIAISGHVHEHARSITLSDITTGKVLWEGKPVLDAEGKVTRMPVANFAGRWGVRLLKSHRYRVSVVYENPTTDTLRAGGMGVVGGLVLPAFRTTWPKADTADSTYGLDRSHYMRVSVQQPG
jgi:hypothetical protein